MINSNTSFGKLKSIVVGRELELPKRTADFTFRNFYKENLGHAIYDRLIVDGEQYYVEHELLIKRNYQLDLLANTLSQLGIKVFRPDRLSKVIPFSTPDFKSELSSASNVRDITLVYEDVILETPTYVRNRFFENQMLYSTFNDVYQGGQGGKWIKAPFNSLVEEKMDMEPWNSSRDYASFDRSKYTMAIDGAQYLRIGRDVIVNINSYNHYLGHEWIKSLFPNSNFHIVHVADNHIDGAIVCLAPGYFLLNPIYTEIIDVLPEKFKSWKFLIPEDREYDNKGELTVSLASQRGMDINVLSLDEKTVVVNKMAMNVISLLEREGFEVIPVELDNCEIFGGGIHCSTLDLLREDECIDYA